MSKTKTYEFADCHHKIVVNGQELQCLLREGHAGDCVSQYWWKSNVEQQSVKRTADDSALSSGFHRDVVDPDVQARMPTRRR